MVSTCCDNATAASSVPIVSVPVSYCLADAPAAFTSTTASCIVTASNVINNNNANIFTTLRLRPQVVLSFLFRIQLRVPVLQTLLPLLPAPRLLLHFPRSFLLHALFPALLVPHPVVFLSWAAPVLNCAASVHIAAHPSSVPLVASSAELASVPLPGDTCLVAVVVPRTTCQVYSSMPAAHLTLSNACMPGPLQQSPPHALCMSSAPSIASSHAPVTSTASLPPAAGPSCDISKKSCTLSAPVCHQKPLKKKVTFCNLPSSTSYVRNPSTYGKARTFYSKKTSNATTHSSSSDELHQTAKVRNSQHIIQKERSTNK